jgi:non-ribosomal peptide synthetase component F
VPGRNPLFDVGFTLQNQIEVQHREESHHLRMTEMTRDDEAFEDPEAATDLWFVARKDEGDLILQVVYNGARFSQARVDRLSQDLLAIATAAGTAPETQVKSVLLSATEQPRAGRTITIDLEL